MKNVPKFLTTYLLDEDKINITVSGNKPYYKSMNGKPIVILNFIDKRFSNRKYYKREVSRIISQNLYKYWIDGFHSITDIKLIQVNILNEGFKIRLNTINSKSKNYSEDYLIELEHDSFSDLSYQPAIFINSKTLLELLSKYDFCNGVFSGNFKLSLDTLFAYNTVYSFVEKDDENIVNKYSIYVGEALSKSRRKTSNWIPGHLYVTNERNLYLCLGKLTEEITTYGYYNSIFPTSIRAFLNIGNYNFELPKKIDCGYILLNLSNNVEFLSIVSSFRNKEISIFNFIKKILYTVLKTDNYFHNNLVVLSKNLKRVVGQDLDRPIIFVDYDYNLDNIYEIIKNSTYDLFSTKLVDINSSNVDMLLLSPDLLNRDDIFSNFIKFQVSKLDIKLFKTYLSSASIYKDGDDLEKLRDFIKMSKTLSYEETSCVGGYSENTSINRTLSILKLLTIDNNPKYRQLNNDKLKNLIVNGKIN